MNSVARIVTSAHLATPASPEEFAACSRFYRLDPRAEIVAAMVFAVAVSPMIRIVPLIISFVASLILLAISGIRLRALARQMRLDKE